MPLSWSKFAKIVGVITFISAGFLAYGDGVLFEQIYISLLVFLAVIFIKDVNVLGVIVITLIANLCFMFLFPLVLEAEFQVLLKLLTYSAIITTLYKLRTEEYRVAIAFIIGLCGLAELYWFATDYPAPLIYWHVMLINIAVLVRHFLFQRFFIMSKYCPKHYRSLDLDYSLHKLNWYYIVVHFAVLLEFFVRHILGFREITFIHQFNPYVFHAITTYSALLIIIQGYSLIRYEWFKT